jgi:hypothetical protein
LQINGNARRIQVIGLQKVNLRKICRVDHIATQHCNRDIAEPDVLRQGLASGSVLADQVAWQIVGKE